MRTHFFFIGIMSCLGCTDGLLSSNDQTTPAGDMQGVVDSGSVLDLGQQVPDDLGAAPQDAGLPRDQGGTTPTDMPVTMPDASMMVDSAPDADMMTPPDPNQCGRWDEVRAFPGASGFGAVATGGRGGRVIYVDNLNDSGPGSLREAIEAEGPRFVVFSVAGTIELQDGLVIRNPDITIAGQSAPGGGIALKNATTNGTPNIISAADNVIIRYLRMRPGQGAPSTSVDCITVTEGKHIIIANNSMSWSVDENVNFWYDATDITLQDNIIAEGLWDANHTQRGLHSKGFLSGPENVRISLHHNLFSHNDDRNPRVTGLGKNEVVNNVIYNYYQTGTNFSLGEGFEGNLIGNVYIPGRQHRANRYSIVVGGELTPGSMYVRDNLSPRRMTGTEDEWENVGFNGVVGDDTSTYNSTQLDASMRSMQEFTMSDTPVVPEPASTLVDRLLPHVGASRPARDTVDLRIIADVQNGTGEMINDPSEVGGWPTLDPGTPIVDTDRDGLPDDWETAHGLDPMTADSMQDRNDDGYTNLEEYLECGAEM